LSVVFRPKNLGLQYILLLLRFYVVLRFFESPKTRLFTFFALLHTFSRTMLTGRRRGIDWNMVGEGWSGVCGVVLFTR